jgi:hypothetical protein
MHGTNVIATKAPMAPPTSVRLRRAGFEMGLPRCRLESSFWLVGAVMSKASNFNAVIASLQEQATQIHKVTSRLEMTRPTPQLAENNQ